MSTDPSDLPTVDTAPSSVTHPGRPDGGQATSCRARETRVAPALCQLSCPFANYSDRSANYVKQLMRLNDRAEEAIEAAGLHPRLGELVKIRVSQINGCAFCIRLHTREAIAKGETSDRLAVLAAWWESQHFTAQEHAALALAEEVTRLPIPNVGRRIVDRRAGVGGQLARARDELLEQSRDHQPLPGCALTGVRSGRHRLLCGSDGTAQLECVHGRVQRLYHPGRTDWPRKGRRIPAVAETALTGGCIGVATPLGGEGGGRCESRS